MNTTPSTCTRRAAEAPARPAAPSPRTAVPSVRPTAPAPHPAAPAPRSRGFRSLLRALAVALAAAPLAGCCGIASLLCDPPAPKSPPRYTRDTPLDAVDFLVDAIRRDAPGEIYDSLHPELLEREGGISGFQFRSGYERFREEFREDAERFARATRDAPRWRDGAAWVFVQEADASVWLVFRNRPRVRAVAPGEEFVVDDAPPLAELFGVEDGALVLRRPIDLGEQAAFLDPRTLSRVEVSQDWRLFAYAEPRNVRFVERLREMKGAER